MAMIQFITGELITATDQIAFIAAMLTGCSPRRTGDRASTASEPLLPLLFEPSISYHYW